VERFLIEKFRLKNSDRIVLDQIKKLIPDSLRFKLGIQPPANWWKDSSRRISGLRTLIE